MAVSPEAKPGGAGRAPRPQTKKVQRPSDVASWKGGREGGMEGGTGEHAEEDGAGEGKEGRRREPSILSLRSLHTHYTRPGSVKIKQSLL